MGTRLAAYAMLTSERMDAKKCLEHGVVNEVVPYDPLIPRAYELADFIMKGYRAYGASLHRSSEGRRNSAW